MPRLIKCPSCATQMDVGDAQPGTVVGCPGCQVKIRIPTGKTGKMPAVPASATPAPAPAPQVAPARASAGVSRPGSGVRRRHGSTTKTRTAVRQRGARGGGDEGDEEGSRYAPPEKKKNTGLIIGIVAGAVVLVTVIIIIVATSGPKQSGPIARRNSDDDVPANKPASIIPGPSPIPSGTPNPTATPNPSGDEAPKPRPSVKGRARWDLIIDGLKTHGSKGFNSGFYEFESEVDPSCIQAWSSVKREGTAAYPYLLCYLLDEDPARMRGAAAALWTLAQKPGRYPKPGQGQAMLDELKGILGVSDESIKAAEAVLKAGQ